MYEKIFLFTRDKRIKRNKLLEDYEKLSKIYTACRYKSYRKDNLVALTRESLQHNNRIKQKE
ncbi:hypothetical protein [Thermohalobacter berrensis]|uniref:Uncharacterized protein n=1 Tax=Thermohalobacter berrensis TaxID=99594 RepID=A0A419T5J9_9FIRM|nr:hypothetical protein [Thermohalobacter berrensis]RKD32725.1 hypothetical protein BET03_10340 [Thermohalobacter berrensis]